MISLLGRRDAVGRAGVTALLAVVGIAATAAPVMPNRRSTSTAARPDTWAVSQSVSPLAGAAAGSGAADAVATIGAEDDAWVAGGAGALASLGAARRADAARDGQWQLDTLNARAAWRLSTGRGVTVAVIDSGVDGSHPDLANQVLPGRDLVEPGGDGQSDPVGHGTTVATLIAGRNDDRRGAVGLAPDAKILPVRVLDAENRYDDALIVARAVRWAVDNGAQVINLSLGGSGNSPALASAIDYAFASDVVVVACTGNVSPTTPGASVWYPAREPGVVAVAGLDRAGDRIWPGSLTGAETVLTAPATDVLGARPGGYWRVQGTSFAAPLVAATAALIRSRWPHMSAGDVVNRLIGTARDLGPAGRDPRFGFGRLSPLAALTRRVPHVGDNPLDDALSPTEVGFGSAPSAKPTAVIPGDANLGRHPGQGSHGDSSAPGADPGWAVRPAGRHKELAPAELWGVALLIVMTVGALLLTRRSVQGGRVHRGRTSRGWRTGHGGHTRG